MEDEPIEGKLNELSAVSVRPVSRGDLEPLWNKLLRQHHYLGFGKLLGHQLKYLAFMDERPVAALSWSAAALKLRSRDRFIGWSDAQRKSYLKRIANQSRFLILPHVQVPNLASHVLALNIRRLNEDWKERFGYELWLLETFVDPARFAGTIYKAANWVLVGDTAGCGKQGAGYIYHGVKKEVYVYVLNRRFRELIGCKRRPQSLDESPPPYLQKVEALEMMLRHLPWNPDLIPGMELTEEDVEAMAEELLRFHGQFQDYFYRVEHRRAGLSYFSGLLSNLPAKSMEPIALEFLGREGVRPVQHFMKDGRWDHAAMERRHQELLGELIASPEGMLTVDSSEFPKKGKESVGVARQYCGRLGKVENCQSGVFVGYASEKGYGLLTSRLYMPKSWFSAEQEPRRRANRVPEGLRFQSKAQIAAHLIARVIEQGHFPAKWIGCDSTFGMDPAFIDSLPKGVSYLAAIRSDTLVFVRKPKVGLPAYSGRGPRPKKLRVLPGEPQPRKVSQIASGCRWRSVVLAEGAKGPIVAEVARMRVYPSKGGLPQEKPLWLFMRRMPDGQVKYALSNAPRNTPMVELCRKATMRWSIEQCFQEAKDQLGMDHYEHRSWPAWHRHMIYVMLAMHFLLRLRHHYKKKHQP